MASIKKIMVSENGSAPRVYGTLSKYGDKPMADKEVKGYLESMNKNSENKVFTAQDF